MGIVAQAWSRVGRLRARITPGENREERRRRWVTDNARGNSFIDVGGVFQLVGDIAFLAEESGATDVTLFDVGDPDLICAGHPEWGWFEGKKRDRDSKVRYVQGDLEDPEAVARAGVHDLVFYCGVLYHTPNPVRQLINLRELTGKLAYISTLTIPEIPGFPQACVFYPHLPEGARRAVAAGYPTADGLLAIGTPTDERPMYGYGNCWWGITRSALYAMLRTARFEVVEEVRLPSRWVTEVIVRPLPLDPMLPPVSYFRERGDALQRGEPRWSFDEWYEEQRKSLPTDGTASSGDHASQPS